MGTAVGRWEADYCVAQCEVTQWKEKIAKPEKEKDQQITLLPLKGGFADKAIVRIRDSASKALSLAEAK
eukprot:6451013-Heterocapsa_arctica.AAC.2